MRRFGFTLAGLLCSVLLGLLSIPAFADSAESSLGAMMQVAPVIEELSLKPTEQVDKTVSVTNPSDQDLKVRVYVAPYSFSAENNASDFESQTEYTQIYHWIKIVGADSKLMDEAPFTVGAKQTVNIHYQINVPSSAAGGSQHACLFIETVPPEKTESSKITTVSRAVVKLFAEVDGEITKDAEILDLATNTFVISGKVSASATVKNLGNVDIKPTLTLKINSLGGDTVFSYTDVAMVFPDNSDKLKAEWPETPAFGIFNLITAVNILGKNSTIEKLIIILPSWFIILLLTIIVAIIIKVLHYRKIRNIKKKREKRKTISSKTNK